MNAGFTEEETEAMQSVENDVAKAFTEYLGVDEEIAVICASNLCSRLYLSGDLFFDRKHDVAGLDKFERALADVRAVLNGEISSGAHDALAASAIHGRYGAKECDEAEQYRTQYGKKTIKLLVALHEYGEILREASARTRRIIEDSERAKSALSRMNVEAINLVHEARISWERECGLPAPSKSLNPASRFGAFLADLFEALGVESNAQAAFRAWAKHVGADEVDT